MNLAVIGLLILLPFPSIAQKYAGYADSTIARLHTAQSSTFLSLDERETILLLNMVRDDGARFWKNIASPYIALNEIKQDRFTRSLEKELFNTGKLPLLFPNDRLSEAAKRHASASGKSGKVGHTSSAGTFEKRLRPLNDRFNYILENCDYGSSKAIDIVMSLLIDEGVPDLGHRKNILNDRVNRIGVSIETHKSYQFNCVQVFGQLREL